MSSLRLLIKESGVLLIALMFANVANGLFQLIMGSLLSAHQFGDLSSLLSVFLILSVPLAAVQTVTTKYVASYKAISDYQSIKQLMFSSFRFLAVLGTIMIVLLIGARTYISGFLRIDSTAPVLILAVSLFLSFMLPVGRGLLQGLQEFNYLGINVLTDTTLRLITAVILVLMGLGAGGALLGSVVGSSAALMLAFFPLVNLVRKSPGTREIDFFNIYSFFWPTAATIFFFYILISMDMIIVKHFFEPLMAGYYSGAVILGKVVFFLPTALSLIMFSKSSEQHSLDKDTLPDLKRYLAWTGIISGLATTIFFLIPEKIMLLIGFAKYLPVSYLVGFLGLAMAFYALNNILFLYQLSVHSYRFIWVLAFTALIQGLLMWFFHSSLFFIVIILVVSGCLLFVINFVIVFSDVKLPVMEGRP